MDYNPTINSTHGYAAYTSVHRIVVDPQINYHLAKDTLSDWVQLNLIQQVAKLPDSISVNKVQSG